MDYMAGQSANYYMLSKANAPLDSIKYELDFQILRFIDLHVVN